MNSRLNRIKDWEALAQANHYSSSAIAQECGVTVRQLERFFLEHHRTSPHKWLREKRMYHAVKLLVANLSVKETAAKLAYKDIGHFTRDFKEFYGITPSHCDPQSIAAEVSRLNVAFRQEMSRFDK